MNRATAAVGALALAAFCFGTAESLPIGLLGLIAEGLDTDPTRVGLLVTGYGLTVAVVSVPLVRLAGRMPRRTLLVGVLAAFALATVWSAVATGYWTLLGARLLTALAHAVFWPVAVVAAAGLVAPGRRGRAAAFVFGGGSLAVVLGVPAGTWLGQQAGWRAAFAVLSVLGAVALAAVVALLRPGATGPGDVACGTEPSRRGYLLLVTVTALGVGGVFSLFTYVTDLLTRDSGYPDAALGPLLALNGAADIAGLVFAGAVVDRGPRALLGGSLALLSAALLGMAAFGTDPVAAAVLLALLGFGLPGLATAMQARAMQTAPGDTAVASAGASAAFNVGIGGGALVGGLVLPVAGARGAALAGGLLAVAASAMVVGEQALGRRGVAARRAAVGSGIESVRQGTVRGQDQ
ncbi:MFS transporter [Actinomadura kijaniata]|uniref:DHA1 family inner membrane transport protein n=1 Tax=Actinomadura namibiensis TaxID=182080 RepID=A0A7W3LPT1_ACTNM|nr:MFS transporter [Actinomadura namibiensis]MBA8952044.1 DHA1 family inner membrane transport protein [Actinomadura namibiensis]